MGIKKDAEIGKWEFENSKLLKNVPSDLVPEQPGPKEDEQFRGFLLTLALLFNDLKNLILLNDTVSPVYKSKPYEVNGHFGERFGVRTYLIRLLHSSLHEAVVLLRESKEVCESERMKSLIARTPGDTQIVWNILKKIANEEPIDDARFDSLVKLTQSLKQVRNNIGFHFQTEKQLLRENRYKCTRVGI
jgi:hypothetical protein